jgi:hypothetical protein
MFLPHICPVSNLAASDLSFLHLFTGVRGETVWKIGMSPGMEVPEVAKWRPRGPIGGKKPPMKHARDVFGRFPNSVSRHAGNTESG